MKVAISGVEFLDKSLDEFCQIAFRLGVHFVELWPPQLKNGIEEVKATLQRYGLQVACINCPIAPNKPNAGDWRGRLQESIQTAAILGAKFVSTFFGVHPDRSFYEAVTLYRDAIRPYLTVAHDYDVTILVENEFDPKGQEPTRTAEQTCLLLELINDPALRLTFDPCNFLIAGEEPFPHAYELLKNFIAYVHVKDATRFNEMRHGKTEQHKLFISHIGRFVCVPVGEGAVNFSGLLNALQRDGYDGFLTLEPHTTPEKLLPTFETSIHFLRRWASV